MTELWDDTNSGTATISATPRARQLVDRALDRRARRHAEGDFGRLRCDPRSRQRRSRAHSIAPRRRERAAGRPPSRSGDVEWSTRQRRETMRTANNSRVIALRFCNDDVAESRQDVTHCLHLRPLRGAGCDTRRSTARRRDAGGSTDSAADGGIRSNSSVRSPSSRTMLCSQKNDDTRAPRVTGRT